MCGGSPKSTPMSSRLVRFVCDEHVSKQSLGSSGLLSHLRKIQQNHTNHDSRNRNENQIILPPNLRERRRCSLQKRNRRTEQTTNRHRQSFRSDRGGEDLGGVDVGGCVCGCGVEAYVQEEEEDGGGSDAFVAGLLEDGDGDAFAGEGDYAACEAEG